MTYPYDDFDDLGEPLTSERSTPPQPYLHARRYDAPELSTSVRPNRMSELVPTDPRMQGWRQYDPKRAINPHRYRGVDTDGDDETWHGGRLYLVWEHPVTGELRRCAAARLEPWTDPWAADNARVLTEIQKRGAAGWMYSDEFWTARIKPVPKRERKRPADPAVTLWGRVKDRWWWMTHPKQKRQLANRMDLSDSDDFVPKDPTTNWEW